MDNNCTQLQDSIEIIDTFRNLPKQIQLAALGWAIAKAGEPLNILTDNNRKKKIFKKKSSKSA